MADVKRVERPLSPHLQIYRVQVTSVAIEQGVQSGKPYRFESTEQYELAQVGGKWLATKAETTQK